MRTTILAASAAAALLLAAHADAQSNVTIQSSPGVVHAQQSVKVQATIKAIDAATCQVTLQGPQGKELTVVCSPEVVNFAQMAVGDRVEAEYYEALTMELKKGGGLPVVREDHSVGAGAQPGMKPAGAIGHQITVVADVTDLDPQTQTPTLRGPQNTVELKVRDPEQFKLVAKGDQVQATYTEAIAISVQPMK